MTERTSRIQKYMLCFLKKSVFLGTLQFYWKKKFGKNLIFFHAIFKFLMAPFDAQQNFMSMEYNFSFLSLLDQKL